MLTLKSLSFQNIGRFTEPQTIDFTQLGSLVQVDGQNLVTSGSSGSGKTTIFKALNWLMGLDGPATTVLQSRLTKDHIQVSALFDFDGQVLKIERGKKLSIELNGTVVTGSSKLTEEKLDELVGMDRDLFSKVLHKKQGSGGFFLDLGPSETHKFLTNCLGLQKERSKLDTLDIRLEVLTKEASKHQSDVESNNAGLEATKSAVSSLGLAPTVDMDPTDLEALKKAHIEASTTHRLVLSTLKAQMDELEKSRPQVVVIPYDRSKIEQLEANIANVKAQIAELDKVELNRQSEVKAKISELQILSSKLANSELTRQSEIKNQIAAVQGEIALAQIDEQKRQSTVKSTISALQVESIKNQALVNLGNKAREEAVALAKELQKVRSAVCPTCDQSWITDTCNDKEAEILAKISEHKKSVMAGNEAASKITAIDEKLEVLKVEAQPKQLELNGLNERIALLTLEAEPQVVPEVLELSYQIEHLKIETQRNPALDVQVEYLSNDVRTISDALAIERKAEQDHQFTENAKSQLILVKYAQKQTELREEHQTTIQFAQEAESKSLADLTAAEYKIKAFEEAKNKFEESEKKLLQQADHYAAEKTKAETDLSLVQEELELAQESKLAIKSYLSCSFEDALESIGDAATKLIRNIPNMATATIQFDGLKENKDGKVKEEVNAVISMDGEVGVPVKSLSGGERSSTDLAIDLAVIQFIEERTQKGINIMILDEPFTGLDTVNITEALEMLKACSVSKQLLIVEHNPVASQSIESRLTVIRDGQTSRIVQQ